MKKILAFALALVVALALAVPAMAWSGVGNSSEVTVADGITIVSVNNQGEATFVLTIGEDAALGVLKLRHTQSGDIIFDAYTGVAATGTWTFAQGTVQYIWTPEEAPYIVSEKVTGFTFGFAALAVANNANVLTFTVTETVEATWSNGDVTVRAEVTEAAFGGLANNINGVLFTVTGYNPVAGEAAVYTFTARGNFNAGNIVVN